MKTPIIKYINTEKTNMLLQSNIYVFKVANNSKTDELKKEIESLFNVEVTKINSSKTHCKVVRFKGTHGVRSGYKKIFVTIKQGQSIPVGMSSQSKES